MKGSAKLPRVYIYNIYTYTIFDIHGDPDTRYHWIGRY